MRSLFIMSFTQFHDDVMSSMHHLHVAIIATTFHMTIDELIDDAYANEFDDYEIYTCDDFNRMIENIFSHTFH